MIKLGLTLLGWGKTLAGWLQRNPLAAILALSLFANWVLLERGNRYRDRLDAIKPAQHQATAAQIAVNHEPARVAAEIARQSNAQAPDYYRAVRAAAIAHRLPVRPCPVGGADLPGTDSPAAIDDGSAPAADMVSRPRADDEQIIAAAGRAAQMHADAQALIASGIAVAEPDTPAQ